MLNHSLMTFDELGRIRCTLESVEIGNHFNGGTPIKDGLVCLSALDVEVYLSGLGYLETGNICSEQVAAAEGAGSVLTNSKGQLRASDEAPAFWYSGLPVSADGRLAIVIVGGMPAMEFAFSSAFNSGFDSPTAP